MQTAFTLRPFRTSDLNEVMKINRICLPENYTTFFFIQLHEQYPATFIVSEENERIVGYIMCRIETSNLSFGRFGKARIGHIISIAVLPEKQHQGMGFALIKEAIKKMTVYEATECYLEVRASNTEAVTLYQKIGFKISRTIRKYYLDGEDAYMMSVKTAI